MLATILVAPTAGCAGIKQKDRQSRLGNTLTAYVGAIRWGNFETAAAFAVPRSGPRPNLDLGALAGVKVTGSSIRVNRIDAEGGEASVSISFTYYRENRATIDTVVQDAIWYYDEPGQHWLMDDSLPPFRP